MIMKDLVSIFLYIYVYTHSIYIYIHRGTYIYLHVYDGQVDGDIHCLLVNDHLFVYVFFFFSGGSGEVGSHAL